MKFAGIGGTTSCDSKQKFQTRESAERRKSNKRSKDVKPYHCPICGYWHNGSIESHRKKSLVRKVNRQEKLDKAEAYDDRIDYEDETAECG